MKKEMQHSGSNTVSKQTQPMPGVKNKSTMPETRQVNGKSVAAGPAPSRGQTARSPQGEKGSTSPSSDAGGEGGNSSMAMHKRIFGK